MSIPKKVTEKSFAAALKKHRERLNLTQSDLAELLGMSDEWASKAERGLAAPAKITMEGALARLKFAPRKEKK